MSFLLTFISNKKDISVLHLLIFSLESQFVQDQGKKDIFLFGFLKKSNLEHFVH